MSDIASRVTRGAPQDPDADRIRENVTSTFPEIDSSDAVSGVRGVRVDRRLGARLRGGNEGGVRFAVAAPGASSVAVIGEFNDWNAGATPMTRADDGVWEAVVPEASAGALYKFHLRHPSGHAADKADPLAFASETPPGTASRVWNLSRYRWQDDAWMRHRHRRHHRDAPLSIYEVHLGSWRRRADGTALSYREVAPRLADYVTTHGFTHAELMPVAEHPFGGSWGYQTVSYFAPTSRYGTPDDFKALVDTLHRAGVGVLLDWVPGHFPADAHGLVCFDGAGIYEHPDPRQRHHPDWHTLVFNHGSEHVVAFLTSCALFWLEQYHVDGFRVDGVASMLYLDYSRRPGEWTPNRRGGHENLDAIEFLRTLTDRVSASVPDALMIAEESTAWPGVSHPTERGGLGFDLKWNMGWMHDLLDHMSVAPETRHRDIDRLTASLDYAFAERFVLPLSHDEVVHGKGPLLDRMPGGPNERFADLRLLYAWMFGHPGKKLLFMGNELGQPSEWHHDGELDWARLEDRRHAGIQRWVRDLNWLYRGEPALHVGEHDPRSFEWVTRGDTRPGLLAFLRRPPAGDPLLFVYNFGNRCLDEVAVGVPVGGFWAERLNSDGEPYGGDNIGNLGGRPAEAVVDHPYPFSLRLLVPPRSALVLSPDVPAEVEGAT